MLLQPAKRISRSFRPVRAVEVAAMSGSFGSWVDGWAGAWMGEKEGSEVVVRSCTSCWCVFEPQA